MVIQISFASRSDLVRFHPLLPYLCALRLHGGRPPSATPDSNLYLMRLFFHWRQIPMVTYGDVGKQTSLSNQRNAYIHIAFTMGVAILRLLYPYLHKSRHMVFRFENTTFQHFFTCGDSMGWLFHAMELLWSLKIRNSFCLRLCCVCVGRNFWGDFWGWMGCGVPCGRASPVQCWGDYRGPLYLNVFDQQMTGKIWMTGATHIFHPIKSKLGYKPFI